MKSYSQSGEDILARKIFDVIGDGGQTCVDFGASDGSSNSNTKLFRDAGWKPWLFDINPRHPGVIKAEITPDSVNDIFDQHGVPDVIDLLSIDVDGMDIWIFEALRRKARVVIVEFNPSIPAHMPVATPYPGTTTYTDRPGHPHPYYGASVSAIEIAGKRKAMTKVAWVGVNVVLVANEEASNLAGKSFGAATPHFIPGEWKTVCNRPWTRIG